MVNKVHVKKGDTVYVLSGKDRNKKGKVLRVIKDKGMVLIEGVNIATKHKKPRGQYEQGGIVRQELPIYSSKVALVCNKCSKPTRVGRTYLESGEKVRVCKKCNEVIDVIKEAKGK